MEDNENIKLLTLTQSADFTISSCISLLQAHSGNVGIFSYLSQRLKQFKYEDIEFYVPQLCQILVTVETESMALEDLLIELSSQYPHFTLLTFWHLQAHLLDFSDDPECYGFQVARRVLNALQYFLFNAGSPPVKNLRENSHPAFILSSAIAGSFAMPQLGPLIQPLAISQGRKQRSFVFELAKNFAAKLSLNITAKNTKLNAMSAGGSREASFGTPKNEKYEMLDSLDNEDKLYKIDSPKEESPYKAFENFISGSGSPILGKKKATYKNGTLTAENLNMYPNSSIQDLDLSASKLDLNSNAQSLPDFRDSYSDRADSRSEGNSVTSSPPLPYGRQRTNSLVNVNDRHTKTHSHRLSNRTVSPSLMTTTTKIKLLKSNYFKCETQFVISLQQISMRISQVPKEARLTRLNLELSLLNRDLPAEVDIPTLLPPAKKLKLHKMVRITPNEAAVLNSAEKVPFLLLIEYLSDEIDFDASSETNMKILRDRANKKYIFDIGTPKATRLDPRSPMKAAGPGIPAPVTPELFYELNVEEEDLGDLSVIKLSNKGDNDGLKTKLFIDNAKVIPSLDVPNESRGRRGSNLNFSSRYHFETGGEAQNAKSDKVEPEDLATHMKIAAVMLTQLDNPTSTLQSDQSAAIKARIIESMQSLQDNFGYNDIQMVRGQAGDRKLENDLMLGGLNNNSETEYLGEDWDTKRERIRKESPYGHLDNWELCSVISKTGDDLRQEAFACQLIQAMSQIWIHDHVGVWVKRMRILITSYNTGLVETITNALSIHSIKKALTQITIEDGENPKGTFASLSLHFKKVFGDVNSVKYQTAQEKFAASLAAYSIICYLLQIKDRHNGNIMLDNEGHIIHIDFGFLLSNSPGSVGFEASPFKLTTEYVEILGGIDSKAFLNFKQLLKQAFLSVRRHADLIVQMVELMQRESLLPCFKAGAQTASQLKQRFQLHLSESECEDFVENVLIQKSLGSLYTRLYDQFQLLTQGIYS